MSIATWRIFECKRLRVRVVAPVSQSKSNHSQNYNDQITFSRCTREWMKSFDMLVKYTCLLNVRFSSLGVDPDVLQ